MKQPVAPAFALTFAMVACIACDEPNPKARAVTAKAAVPSAPVYKVPPPEARPADTLAGEVWAWAKKDLPGFEPSGEYQRGSLAEGESQEGALVFEDGRCARVLAVGDNTITDLDLSLYDPNGSIVRRDTAEGPRAEAGLLHPVCPSQPGVFHVRVTARKGAGAYALRSYQSPF